MHFRTPTMLTRIKFIVQYFPSLHIHPYYSLLYSLPLLDFSYTHKYQLSMHTMLFLILVDISSVSVCDQSYFEHGRIPIKKWIIRVDTVLTFYKLLIVHCCQTSWEKLIWVRFPPLDDFSKLQLFFFNVYFLFGYSPFKMLW